MENVREHIYLAALLRNIEEFYRRTNTESCDKQNEFLVKIQDKFEKIHGIKHYHKPQTELQAIVTMADWWSSGIDRRETTEIEDETDNNEVNRGKEHYRQDPLYSIFNVIHGGQYKFAFPLQALNTEKEKCFPKLVKEKTDGVNEQQYNELWQLFSKEFENLPADSFNGFAESLLFLLKKYTWCIPSNTMDMTNVSLYEHLKTTAAFADCLFLYKLNNPDDFQWNETDKKISINDDVFPVILLGGDISGIQKFIYNIASTKAAVSLKGRSFYLQLLIDSVIQRIISHPDINVNIGNVVYSSGGKFYMLLPNINNVHNAIRSLKEEFEKELWNEHYGQLLLNINFVPFAYSYKSKELRIEGQTGKTLGDLWKCLSDKLTLCKNQKFKSILEINYNDLFTPVKAGGNVKVCAVTGIESDKCIKLKEEKDSPFVLPIVKYQTELGSVLKDVDYILTHKQNNEQDTYLNNHSKINMTVVGISNYLFDQIELTNDDAEFRRIASININQVKRVNNTDFLAAQIKGHKVSYGFQFYGGNKQAEKLETSRKMNKSFEDLADGSYLGILRMDVDNLGKIFISGLPDENKSFAAYATLSFLLDYFFSGYLNTIRNKDDFKDDVNILYSGGDDIFAVGKWDKLILFAKQVRENFNKFVGRNDISISGGITIVGDKYPIAKAAELAGDAEDAAKKFNNGAKDAFNIFGQTVSWKSEFDLVLQWKKDFVEKCSIEKMPRSILHKLMTFAEMKNRGELKYVWHTVYYLKRFSERGNGEIIKPFCEKLKTTILSDSRMYDLIAIAARWAELELRDKNKQ
jgi:CRISPR-associated protein Csm1